MAEKNLNLQNLDLSLLETLSPAEKELALSILKEYAEKAWRCGLRNHQIQKIQDGIYADFCNVIQKRNEHK